MRKILIAILCLQISTVNALTLAEFNQEHTKKQQKLFASLDYCSNIGAEQIFKLGSESLSKVKKNLKATKKSFNEFKIQKTNCFDNSKDFLDTIIAENFIAMQDLEDEITLDLQNRADQKLAESITLRKKVNIELIDSILVDIDNTLTVKEGKKLSKLFVKESLKTKTLMAQELKIIYDSMQEQLQLDQYLLGLSPEKDLNKVASISLRSAFLSLNRSLLLFEDIEDGSKTYNLARLKTFLDLAYNKVQGLKAFSNNLEGLDSKKDVNTILNKLAIIKVDVEVTIKDLTDETFSDNFLGWAGKIYSQTSEVITQLQTVLDTIYMLDMVKEPMPVDITMKEEFLEFSGVAAIKPVSLKEIELSDKKTRSF